MLKTSLPQLETYLYLSMVCYAKIFENKPKIWGASSIINFRFELIVTSEDFNLSMAIRQRPAVFRNLLFHDIEALPQTVEKVVPFFRNPEGNFDLKIVLLQIFNENVLRVVRDTNSCRGDFRCEI